MDKEVFTQITSMMGVAVVAMVVVLLAMAVDLVSGIRKAKQRGDMRTSRALRQTLSKFVSYQGGLLIASGIDVLIHLCKAYELFHLNIISGVPVVTCMVAIFLCIVEWLSVREKADKKTKKNFSMVETAIINALSKPENRDLLLQLLSRSGNNDFPADDGGNFEDRYTE